MPPSEAELACGRAMGCDEQVSSYIVRKKHYTLAWRQKLIDSQVSSYGLGRVWLWVVGSRAMGWVGCGWGWLSLELWMCRVCFCR